MSGSLEQQAEQFARELSDLASAFTGAPLPFRSSSLDTRVSVAPDAPIPVSVDDTTLFSVSAWFRCVYDHVNDFLRIDTSAIKVFAGPGARGEPLFRYEYVSSQSPDLPSAHLQIHAHRDQLMMAMAIAGSTGARRRAQLFTDYPATAQMARLHFPMGGRRFRPGLEDVLQMLHTEFGASVGPDWETQLQSAREGFRRIQTAAAVRDAPAEAVRVLENLGCEIKLPPGGLPPERKNRLRAF